MHTVIPPQGTILACCKLKSTQKGMKTYYFLSGTENAELSKTYMERRASKRTVRLFDDDDIDSAGERRRVDLIVEDAKVTYELANVVHAVHCKLARMSKSLTN